MRILDFIAGLFGSALAGSLLLALRLFGVRFEFERTLTVGKGARLFWRRRLVFREGRVARLAARLGLGNAPDCLALVKGHLALVGPRPLAPLEPHAVASYRISMRPGLLSPFAVGSRRFAGLDGEDTADFIYSARRTFQVDLEILIHAFRQAFHSHPLAMRNAH